MTTEMTSRQRLLAVLNQHEADRVPIWLLYPREYLPYYADVHHLPSYSAVLPSIMKLTDWFDRRGIAMPPFYTSEATFTENTFPESGWTVRQNVLHTPYGKLTSQVRYDMENAAETTTIYLASDLADLEKILAIPYHPVDPDISSFIAAASQLGEDGLMMLDPGMSVGITYELLGPEAFAIYSIEEPEMLFRFSKIMFERQYAFLKSVFEKTGGLVIFPVDSEYLSPPLVSPKTFDRLVAPFYEPIFTLVHQYGGKVISHHHGKINLLLERLANLGADGIHPIEEPPVGDCSLEEAKRRVGDHICLVGSVQWDDFERLSSEEMEDLVRRQIRDAAAGGGMILAPSAGPYPRVISPMHQENTLRFIEAGLKWGRYPLVV